MEKRAAQQEPSVSVVWKYRFKKYGLRVGVGLFALYAVITFFMQSATLARQVEELASVQQLIAEAELHQAELKATYEYMQTDEYIERYARDHLGYVREGEIRFVNTGAR